MTETKQAQITLGQAVGQAEAVLTRLLSRVLAETGTERQTYLALQRLAALGVTDRDTYLRDLGEWLELDLWAAGELSDKLAAGGLLEREGETVRLSPQGAGLRARILSLGGQTTATLTGPLDPADVATTIRILQDVTARARELLAR